MRPIGLLPVQAAIVFLLLICCECSRDVYVTSSSACGEYDLSDDDEINIHYNGATLSGDCEIEIDEDSSYSRICVDAVSLSIPGCSVEVEIHAAFKTSIADKTYTCSSGTFGDEYCTYSSSLVVVLSQKGYSSSSADIQLRVYPKKSDFDIDLGDIAETAVVGVYVIVGIIIGSIVLLVIIVIIVVCCCCKRRGASGTVYRNQQPAPQPVQGTYPQVQYQAVSPQAAGYQPPPQGYQPPPAQGYQPPPPQGYQPPPPQGYQPPPPQGYHPPPQGYSAPPPGQGFQLSEVQKMPSAPPPEKGGPPPYSSQ